MIDEHQQAFITRSCREYGKLDDAAIAVILDVTKMLKLFSQISDYEVFIDIKVADEDLMFVIAEQLSEKSYYEYSYLGDFIYRDNEPAVFKACLVNRESTHRPRVFGSRGDFYSRHLPAPFF